MAEQGLVVPGIVPQTFLIPLERTGIVLLDMLDLAKYEVES